MSLANFPSSSAPIALNYFNVHHFFYFRRQVIVLEGNYYITIRSAISGDVIMGTITEMTVGKLLSIELRRIFY